MDENKIKEILKSWRFHSSQADSLQELLYSSLLAFNGILITAFSIMVAINSKAYSPFIIPFFITSFIPVVGIVLLIFDMRQSAYAAVNINLQEPKEAAPELFQTPAEQSKERFYPAWLHRLLYRLDLVFIALSLFNPIFIFIMIYNGR